MRVLHINTQAHKGGAARAMRYLHQGLERMGHDSTILAKAVPTDEPQAAKIAEVTGQSSHPLWRPRRTLAVGVDRRFASPCLHATHKLLETELYKQTEVVQLHNLHGYYFDYSLLPRLSHEKPVIWTLHDMWALTGHCAYSFDCDRWRTGCYSCPLLVGKGRQFVEPRPTWTDRTRATWRHKRAVYERSRLHVVAPSHWLCDLVLQSVLAEAASIQCIPYGIDLDVFRPMERTVARSALAIPSEARVLLFVAAQLKVRRKGLSLLLQALKGINDDEPIILLTLGDTRDVPPAFGSFERRDLGQVDSDQTLTLAYNAADVFVVPTMADNQPLVIIESLACGTPVVSFNVGGVPEMVHNMETGYLAQCCDVEDLANGIRLLLANHSLRAKMRESCRAYTEVKHSLELQARRYSRLYTSVISRHSQDHGTPLMQS